MRRISTVAGVVSIKTPDSRLEGMVYNFIRTIMGLWGPLVPRVRVTERTLKEINQLQGFLQMASGERISQNDTILYAVTQIPKIIQTADAKGRIRTWILDLRGKKGSRR